MKIRKLRVLLGSMFLVAALAVSLAAPVMAQPPVTSPCSGTVTIDAVAAPTGTVVDVYVDGDLQATTTTTAVGWYEVIVSGAAADVGLPVTFTVDGLPAVTTPATPLFASYQPQIVNLAAVTGVTYTLTVTISPTVGGSVTQAPNLVAYPENTVVTLTATEATGYDFSSWSGDASGSSSSTTVTMNSNKSVAANFVVEGAPPAGVPVVTDISSVTVSVAPLTISTPANYVLTFRSMGTAVPNDAANYITVYFPLGTIVPATGAWANNDISVQSTAGFGVANAATFINAANVTTVTATIGPIVKFTLQDLNNAIGEGVDVRVKFLNQKVTNPPTIATYTLKVALSAGTAVESGSYTLTAPIILPLPGVVERYNSVGVLMQQTNVIQTAINAASPGDSITVGPGTYDEIIDINKPITLTGNAADTILADIPGGVVGGVVTISFPGTAVASAVLDGFTIKGNLTTPDALTITGQKATVQNCIFTKAGTFTTVSQNMVHYNPLAAVTLASTITNCTFDTTLGTVVDNGILVATTANANALTISNCTFTVDSAVGAEDNAINTGGGIPLLPTMASGQIKVSGNTFSGGSGIGVRVTAGVASVTDNTFSGLNSALNIAGGTATIQSNTIDSCGLAISATAPVGQAAIHVVATAGLTVTNNDITDSLNDIIEVDANANLVNMMFNNLSGNAKGVDNDDGVNTVNATHNWWGAATGPVTGFNTGLVDASGYLGATGTGGSFIAGATAVSLLTKTTVGVDVIPTTAAGVAWIPVAADIIGGGNYAENPQDATTTPALAGGFYDVFLVDSTGQLGATSQVLIKFYNANITEATEAWAWSTLQGKWAKCDSQGVNTFGGYVWVKCTTTSIPAIADLAGTAFALCEAPAAAPATFNLTAPAAGATDMTITNVPFTWLSVAGATSYKLVLSANADLSSPVVTETPTGTAYTCTETLSYSTPYYWQVTALKGTTVVGRSDVATFITEAAPEEAAPPAWTDAQTGLTYDTRAELEEAIAAREAAAEAAAIEAAEAAATPVIPNWALYAIIIIGAVLVIFVIVLILRTRRPI